MLQENVAREFLIDDYRLYLKTHGLTYGTINFYIKYLKKIIEYSKIEKLETFQSEIQIKVLYNKLFDRGLKNRISTRKSMV